MGLQTQSRNAETDPCVIVASAPTNTCGAQLLEMSPSYHTDSVALFRVQSVTVQWRAVRAHAYVLLGGTQACGTLSASCFASQVTTQRRKRRSARRTQSETGHSCCDVCCDSVKGVFTLTSRLRRTQRLHPSQLDKPPGSEGPAFSYSYL